VAGSLLRLLGAAITACLVAALALAVLPDELDVRTDIVGYPTFANFDVSRYLRGYGVAVVVVPLVVTGAYLLLTRFVGGARVARGPIPRPVSQVEAVPAAAGRSLAGVAAGRALLVAVVLAFEVAVSVGQGRLAFAATILAYGLLLGAAAFVVAHRTGGALVEAAGSVNLFAACLVVPALYGVSRGTGVDVSSTGAHHDFPWLPPWIAATGTAALVLCVVVAFRRSAEAAARSALERRVLVLVVAPVGLFVLLASIPGSLGTLDAFEEGQVLAGSSLVDGGAVPWRDVLVAHGVLHDVFGGLVGTWVFEDSRWGVTAGQLLLLEPVAWIGVYYLCAALFGSNWLYLLGSQALVVTGWMSVAGTSPLSSAHVRFLLLPFVLLLLLAVLRRPTRLRAAAFTALLAVQVVVTPEALAAAAAYVATIVLYETYYRERGTGLVAGFPRTRYCVLTGLVLAALWTALLAATHVLDDWAYSWTTLISGHELTGGIPRLVPNSDWFEMAAPVVAVLAAFAIVVVRTRLRRPLAYQDWGMVAMAGFSLVYYPKFLARADVFHLDHAYYVAVPLILYVAYRAITFGEAALSSAALSRGATWFPRRHTLTLPLLVALLLAAPVAPLTAARDVRAHFAPVAVREPVVARIGFDRPGENDAAAIRSLARAVGSLLGPRGTVFDFTNAPGVFHYLLDLRPATRYYHVSLAIRQRTQADLVRRLREAKPDVVAFTSDGVMRSLSSWDGISNQVRHYDVSQYLLDAYVPVRAAGGFVLMAPRGAGATPDRALYFRAPACDWGDVPNFFAPEPARGAAARSLSFGPATPGSRRRWTVRLPRDGTASRYRWLEVETGAPLREGAFVLSDVPGAPRTSRRAIAFRSLDRGGHVIRVRVGSCSQWHGYDADTLQLASSVPQDVRRIRLVRS
jgi:hypothetical protein